VKPIFTRDAFVWSPSDSVVYSTRGFCLILLTHFQDVKVLFNELQAPLQWIPVTDVQLQMGMLVNQVQRRSSDNMRNNFLIIDEYCRLSQTSSTITSTISAESLIASMSD